MSNVFSLKDLKKRETNNVKYIEVDAYGQRVRLGSVSAKQMLDWVAGNKEDAKARIAGLRLLVESLVDADGNRVPEAEIQEYIDAFLEKDNQENGKVIEQVLRLNGFGKEADLIRKNESSPSPSGDSPSGSDAPTTA